MSEGKDLKKKSFADIFKNILKETKKEPEKKNPPEVTNNNNDNVILKDALQINKNEKIIFYEERKDSINDETFFDFIIKGGSRHTDLLVASASYKNSRGGGEPVALSCKWFNVTDNNELREIEGVTGAFYQPCADDIGTRICVQAIPILGLKEYTGMPIFGEVGPLTIDSDVEKIVYENCEKKYAKFSMKIEMMTLIPNNYCFPIEALIEINGNNLIVFSQENEQKHELIHGQIGSGVYPNVHLLKKANNIFEINFSENEKIRFLTNSNRDRDIVALSIRLISGKNLNENENIHTIEEEIEIENEDSEKKTTEIENLNEIDINDKNKNAGTLNKDNELEIEKLKKTKFELYLKLEQLTKDVLRLTKDKDNFKIEHRNLSDSLQYSKKELVETKERLENCTKNYYELVDENKHLNKTLELYMNEKLFLFQELDIYKKQIDENEKNKLDTSTVKPTDEEEEIRKNNDVQSNSLKSLSKNSLFQKITELNSTILQLETEIKEKNKDIQLKIQNIKETNFEKEEILNEVNYLKKKNECLLHEKFINYPSPIKNEIIHENEVEQSENIDIPIQNSLQTQIILKKTMEIQNLENMGEELKKLRQQIKSQEITIESLKIGLSQEINKKNEKSKFKLFGKSSTTISKDQILKKTANDWNFLQKLVNILTETIADKDLALENQKQINKELMKRLEEQRNSSVNIENHKILLN